MRTGDAGLTWTIEINGGAVYLYDIKFIGGTGFSFGNPGVVFRRRVL
jgi:hypothetical protein